MENEITSKKKRRDAILLAAREIMSLQKYCGLITMDEDGHPNIRTMNPFPPDEDLIIWMATNSRCRKVKEIRNNPNVVLYYADHKDAHGFVSIKGKAYLVNEYSEKEKRKRDYWQEAFPDWQYLLLIKVIPEKIEVINYKKNMLNDEITWRIPGIEI
jgi:general stress protein 26